MKSFSTWPLISMLFWLLGVVAGGGDDDLDEATPIEKITAILVEEAAKSGCADSEIASRFFVTEEYLREHYAITLSVARAVRAFSLRKAQTITAYKGNGPLLTWLGRNELGQSLNPQQPGEPEPVLEEKVG